MQAGNTRLESNDGQPAVTGPKASRADAMPRGTNEAPGSPSHSYLNPPNLMTVLQHYQKGELTEAEEICRAILRVRPRDAYALHLLGCITRMNPVIATAFIRKAIAIEPGVAPFHNSLGISLFAFGRIEEALESFQRALALAPELAVAHLNRGALLVRQNRLGEALASFHRAVELRPNLPDAALWFDLARVLGGEEDRALSPTSPEASDPSTKVPIKNWGGNAHRLLYSTGEPDDVGDQPQTVAPELAIASSNLLFEMHYDPAHGRERLAAAARTWGTYHAAAPTEETGSNPGDRLIADPERRLRIGYVSADFHRHPVGYFLEAVLHAHDKSQVEVFCYSNHRGSDDLTERLHAAADHWRVLVGVDDTLASDAIRRDAIDILVDLSGHTGSHRLGIFARKPAPIQVSWLGYFDTTGLPTIDYIFLDRFLCPPGDEHLFVEQVVRLPDTYLCYAPQSSQPVAPLPAVERGFVTFGCFNKIDKISPPVVVLWASLLHHLPTARLCLKNAALADSGVRSRWIRCFADHGIAAERLTLLGPSPYEQYLAAYGEIDIALDPFPFNGGTTTVEALWMGVPVVTLAGDHFVSRMGVSHLNGVGLPELIAPSPEAYLAIASSLAEDLPRLADLRATLRARLLASPLGDAPRFTRGLEAAFRTIWHSWCRSSRPGG